LQIQGTIDLHDVKKELVALGEFARKMKLEEDKSKPNNTAEKDEDDDIMIIDGDLSSDLKTTETTTKNGINKIKGKLLQFHENYRPAYFGSWRKKSSSVRPRTPLKKDEVC
jgi:chromatin assembly factor 1 subunit A